MLNSVGIDIIEPKFLIGTPEFPPLLDCNLKNLTGCEDEAFIFLSGDVSLLDLRVSSFATSSPAEDFLVASFTREAIASVGRQRRECTPPVSSTLQRQRAPGSELPGAR